MCKIVEKRKYDEIVELYNFYLSFANKQGVKDYLKQSYYYDKIAERTGLSSSTVKKVILYYTNPKPIPKPKRKRRTRKTTSSK